MRALILVILAVALLSGLTGCGYSDASIEEANAVVFATARDAALEGSIVAIITTYSFSTPNGVIRLWIDPSIQQPSDGIDEGAWQRKLHWSVEVMGKNGLFHSDKGQVTWGTTRGSDVKTAKEAARRAIREANASGVLLLAKHGR